ncbi:MAG: LLM class F420-dependent oxidoreductase [Myxococcota bacterium]
MKFGLIPVNVGVPNADVLVQAGRKADEVGLESLWTFEHVIVPVDYQSKYPYSADGKMGVTPETNFVDPLLALTAIAANTTKVRLATGVNILSQTNPLYLAKQAASLDFISGGRFMLGVGIGWLKEEFEALGVPFERRGARFDDYVQAMRKVWSGEVVEHQSDFVSWSGFKSYPVPVQERFPVIIGGSKGKAFQRIAKYGDGWYAPTAKLEQLAELMKPLEEACAAEGRDPATVEISCMFVPGMEGLDAVPRYAELGVDRLIVPVMALGTPNPVEAIEKLGEEVIAKL